MATLHQYRSVGRKAPDLLFKKKHKQVPADVTFSIADDTGCGSLCTACCCSAVELRVRYWKMVLMVLLILAVTQLSVNILYNNSTVGRSLFTIQSRMAGDVQDGFFLPIRNNYNSKEYLNETTNNSSKLLLNNSSNGSNSSDGSNSSNGSNSSKSSAAISEQILTGNDHKNDSLQRFGLKNLLSDELPQCPPVPPNLSGRMPLFLEPVSIPEEERKHPELYPGGHYMPTECSARHKVAIIIPFRAREAHLGIWLKNMHTFLQTQQLDYTIFVVEQAGKGKFNRAQLMNVGALESSKLYPFQCYIFHDVDLLPEDNRNIYSCPQQPRHMSVAIDKLNYKLPYKAIFGGVGALNTAHFKKVNGFSNKFWGWGGEDDDMSNRIAYHSLYISRYPANIARYTMLSHSKEKPNPNRYQTLSEGKKRFKNDGANSCRYKVLEVSLRKLYTWIHVHLLKS